MKWVEEIMDVGFARLSYTSACTPLSSEVGWFAHVLVPPNKRRETLMQLCASNTSHERT